MATATTRAVTPTPPGPFATVDRASTPSIHHPTANFGAHLTKSPRGLSPRHSPQPLSGAVALEDERRRQQALSRQTTPNPALAVVQSLIGAGQSPARLHDPRLEPSQMSAPMEKAARALVIPETGGVTGDTMQTSPVSLSSFGSADSVTAPTVTAMQTTAPSSAPKQEAAPQQLHHPHQPPPPAHHQPIAPNPTDAYSNRAFTFPGPLPAEHAPTRQMSLPGFAQNSPKSPSAKRHKCPYCSTDFTRHHNLKSHLLTHSQEKPFECQTCQARFRRLHDLKRHTKLHTGERPHTCPKCGRRFARGDALARHNKGQGGCAGRRASFGIDPDDLDAKGDESMDGIVYHDGEGDDDDDEARRGSEPSRKRRNTGASSSPYRQHSSTYPPVAAGRPLGQSGLRQQFGAPNGNAGSPSNISPQLAPGSISSLHYTASQANMFGHGGMTESPKPLSPGQHDHHRMNAPEAPVPGSRSPSMLSGLPRAAGRGGSPMNMTPVPSNHGPHLPALPGLNPGMAPKASSQGGMKNGQGSMSSHGGSSGSSMRELINNNQNFDMVKYVGDMEARLARMEKEHEAKMSALQNEVTTLRAQLAQQHAQNSQQ